ncbi:MAG: RHS repeat-associated core domain-containing protein [Paludibacteraceae bacterium]|nr:RHS repeat-associated core domain-containing protein [Paludibacteraceae bacterium]
MRKKGNNVYFYHGDHLSSVVLVTDRRAAIVQQFTYMPYGELLVDESSVDLDFRFSAKETDRETGLSYFGARYYDPTVAVWLGTDPLLYIFPGLSPYNYCYSNPIVFIDRFGLEGESYKQNIMLPEVEVTAERKCKQETTKAPYEQRAGYFLYGGIMSDFDQPKAGFIYNSIDVSEFPGASFAKKRNEFSIKNAYNLFVWISCLIGDVETSLDEARKLQNHFNLQETEAETQQSTPEIQIKKEKILKKRVVDSSGFWYKYATDTMIIRTRKAKDVIKKDTMIMKQK